MGRKITGLVFIAIIIFVIIAVFLFIQSSNKKNQVKITYTNKNQPLNAGFVDISESSGTGRAVATLISLSSHNNDVYGEFQFGSIRKQIRIYSPEITSLLEQQTSTEIYTPDKPSAITVDSESKAMSTYNSYIGKDLVIIFFTDRSTINNQILSCNKQFLANIYSSLNCIPSSYLMSYYKP